MKKVIVTGASGFIGNKTALCFLRNGYEVIGWDRQDSCGNYNIIKVDMLNQSEIVVALQTFSPDIIIHCAGSADVGKSVKDPDSDYKGNVTITHNLMFAIHNLGLEKTRIVYLSSAGVYGNPISLPISEEMPLNPLSPYAVHKVMCEELCKYFVSNYGMNVKVARIFSAYGAGLRKQIFWDMHKKANATGRLEMFGTGNESRDYIHVDDVVQCLYLLATRNSENVIFNVANGEEITIREVTEMFAKIAGINQNDVIFNGVVREGDPLNWKADISRIREIGYFKTVSMEKGLKEYVDWADDQE